ncbi:MAG: LysM peptidoglycan-binding domain-containing protein, partial [Clostridiaceae bacterium]|nr:LysM peptidoglycan-binding domain-containing protein [Clostridiaceae bacterium]
RIILDAGIKVLTTEKIEYVSEITQGEELLPTQKPHCCIKIYFAQKDDRLWDVAKRYRVPLSRIMAENDIKDETEVITGRQIFIP